MKLLNDALLITLEPDQPCLEWIAAIGASLKQEPLKNIQQAIQTPAIFVKPSPPLASFNEFLMEHSETFLKHAFSAWTQDSHLWPNRNDAEIILTYFKLIVYNTIVDLRNGDSDLHHIVVLKPREPFKKWLHSVLLSQGEKLPQATNDTFQAVNSAYLLPKQLTSIAEIVIYMQEQQATLWDYELNRYITDQTRWPKSPRNFWDWFEMESYLQPLRLRL